jgi:hypothetical protein
VGAGLGFAGGSFLGGLGGSLGGATLGAGGGAAAGAAAGSIVPVVGTIIGALLGGFAGSLFGSGYDDADAAVVFGGSENDITGQIRDYLQIGSKKYDFASQAKDFGHQEGTINKAVVDYFDGLFGILDEQFGVSVDSILGSKGMQVFHHNKAEKIVKGEGGIQKLLTLYTDQFLSVYGEELTQALKSSVSGMLPGLKLTEDLFGGLENIKTADELNQVLTGISERINAIKSITAPIEEFLKTADMSDTQKQLYVVNQAYEQQRDALKALGVDVTKYVKLEQWRSKQLNILMDSTKEQIEGLQEQEAQIRNQVMGERDSILGSISDMVRELRSGGLAPVQSIESFENQFNDLFSQAKSGTSDDIDALLGYIPKYLDFMSGTGDMKFINERIAQRLEELKPAVDTNYQQILVNETKGIQDQLREANESLLMIYSALRGSVMYGIPDNESGYTLPGYHKGGLATGLSTVGEKGAEWVVPTYEPERSNFLQSVGVDSEAIGRAIAQAMMEGQTSGGSVIINVDGRAFAEIMMDQLDSNGRLVTKIGKIRRAS